jgi:hypothetical protein
MGLKKIKILLCVHYCKLTDNVGTNVNWPVLIALGY